MNYFPSVLNAYPAVTHYVAQIPGRFRQGDSASWTDVPYTDAGGTMYDSLGYTLKYSLAGPILTPVVLTAVPSGASWLTTLGTTQSAALAAGKYWWTAQVFATDVRVTLAEGELHVELDLALAPQSYDGRTLAEKALFEAETALSQFRSGGRVQAYSINNRHMTFQKDSDIVTIVNYWRVRVQAEKLKANPSSRMILTRFSRAR